MILAETLPSQLVSTAARYPDNEAVVDGTVRMTFGEFEAAVIECCRAAMALGIKRGDRVAIWSQNSWQFCVAVIGLQAAGAAIVPINTRFRGDEAADVIRRSKAVAIFTTTGFLGTDYPTLLRKAAPDLCELAVVIMSGEPGTDLSWTDFIKGGGDFSTEDARDRLASISADDIADIVFTSGSTGSPKGVVQPHRHVLFGMASFASARTLCHTDRSLVLAPMFAQFGLRGLAANVIHGAATIIESLFDPLKLLALLERERITDFAGPPTLFSALLSPAAGRYDLSSLRVALLGSTSIPVELVRSLLENKIFDQVFTAWGLTEACGPLTIVKPNDDVERIAHYAGVPLPHVRLRVMKSDGLIGEVGEEGELQAQSPTNMLWYLDEPELTSDTLLDGGWLRTGDIGVIDVDGYVKITDRLKDMVIVGGFNVASVEMEASLRAWPEVLDAAYVGRPDERLGEVGVAFVVAASSAGVDTEALLGWCKENLANFKVPREVHVVDALPLSASLKVDKIALRAEALTRSAQETESVGVGAAKLVSSA